MSAREPSVALVFSPETWVEDLHRHLSHHGGARVRQIVVEPSIALEEEYDVLVVSDRWPALTHGFVAAVHRRGRRVLGVFDPEEPAGKDHLVDVGVDGTIPTDAAISEFVLVLRGLDTAAESARDVAPPSATPAGVVGLAREASVIAVCGPRGSGVTEVALGVAVALCERHRSVVLLDGHESAPALAGRLGLGLEPNLRSAVDACAHGLGSFDDCLVPVASHGRGRLGAVAGHPSAIAAAQVSTQDVLDVVADAQGRCEFVVVDLEERSPTARAVMGTADAVVAVVHASPVGVVRALEWMADAFGRSAAVPLHLVVNHAPRSRFRQEEIRAEIARTIVASSLAWCPRDRAVERAAWDGQPVERGAFRSGCAQVGAVLAPTSRDHDRRSTR
jgi:MinD-like ATPase involved in chromosome partitioning or flagellar assembly